MDSPRLRRVWKRVFTLAWPVMAEQTFRTAMRTTDILVTALFSPAAVVAIGLADLYARFPLRIGLGLGGGAIALSSQDTGAGATDTRDEAVTQALLIGFLTGVPFVCSGSFSASTRSTCSAASSARRPRRRSSRSARRTSRSSSRPPRRVTSRSSGPERSRGRATPAPRCTSTSPQTRSTSSARSCSGSGCSAFPRLEIVGVGLATAAANVLTAGLLCFAIWGSWTAADFARPRDLTIARQLLRVSAPRVLEGFGSELAEFPFNALLLGFGEAVNAGFQIGRRVYQQVTGPLSRGYNVAASILVGQALGAGDPDEARFNGWAVAGLGALTVGTIGIGLVIFAPRFVPLFTDDAATTAYAIDFARVYGVAGVALVCFSALSGSLQGASETRIPLVARVSGMFGFFLGVSWLLGRTAGFGPDGAYVGVFLAYGWMAVVVAVGFRYSGWAPRAAELMAARGSGETADDSSSQ